MYLPYHFIKYTYGSVFEESYLKIQMKTDGKIIENNAKFETLCIELKPLLMKLDHH